MATHAHKPPLSKYVDKNVLKFLQDSPGRVLRMKPFNSKQLIQKIEPSGAISSIWFTLDLFRAKVK